ncbi:D-aminoacyl-tRNA deacylase [Butyricicoccus sp.]|uniref:D-aminoacyl-tRNA deacylase n=1 Tax=Butyricicoccus sp. TaxID=2049021 RepID=UPI002A85DFA5|nr:D-aminoacyl-tRNA deacylase [Butyricicoccus sp.]
MRAVLQRVKHAKVTIDGRVSGEIGTGFLILLGVAPEDTPEEALYLAKKCVGLRVFEDENDKMNLALADVGGKILAVSQFTLYADCRKGKRPNFTRAAKGDQARELYEYFVDCCRGLGVETQTGEFGADMKVELLNDGPVTIMLDTDELIRKK